MIRWKVVNSYRRSLSLPPNSPYSLKYPKGGLVRAVPGTLGIMVFDTKKAAKKFVGNRDLNRMKILKVKSIGRGKRPKEIALVWACDIDKFYKSPKFYFSHKPPDGTICYKAVKVLE